MNNKSNRRKIFITLIICIGACFIGAIWNYVSEKHDMKKFEAVGEIIDLGSYKTYCHIKGEGNSTVVFLTGSGTPSAYTDFYLLQNELSNYAKTITFDFSGFGWSTVAHTPRTVDNLVDELSLLLKKVSSEKDDIIIICHSLGSLEAIRFAQEYPERVKGIVFLDCGGPEFYKDDLEFKAMAINRVGALLRVSGVNRLLGTLGVELPLSGENVRNKNLPDEIKGLDKAMYYRYVGNSESIGSINIINENAKKVMENGTIGDVPILVLSSDSGDKWEETQMELVAWSTKSNQETIKGSEHYIHWSNSAEVIEKIKSFLHDTLGVK